MSENGALPKSEWGPGPWQDEPDEVAWVDERTGLACRVWRSMWGGQLNGYVGVPPTHPYFGWDWGDDVRVEERDMEGTLDDVGIFAAFSYALGGGDKHGTIRLGMTLKAHQGVNFAGEFPDDDRGLWWFGFDCGHAWDVMPGMDAMTKRLSMLGDERTYRDIEYVKKEVTALAFQLRQLEGRVLLDEGVLKMIGVSNDC